MSLIAQIIISPDLLLERVSKNICRAIRYAQYKPPEGKDFDSFVPKKFEVRKSFSELRCPTETKKYTPKSKEKKDLTGTDYCSLFDVPFLNWLQINEAAREQSTTIANVKAFPFLKRREMVIGILNQWTTNPKTRTKHKKMMKESDPLESALFIENDEQNEKSKLASIVSDEYTKNLGKSDYEMPFQISGRFTRPKIMLHFLFYSVPCAPRTKKHRPNFF